MKEVNNNQSVIDDFYQETIDADSEEETYSIW